MESSNEQRSHPAQEPEGAGHGAEGHPGGQGATIEVGAGFGKGSPEKPRDRPQKAMLPGRILLIKILGENRCRGGLFSRE
jgi:hypothetical protein